MSNNKANVQANAAAQQDLVLMECKQGLCAELHMKVQFAPDGKTFDFVVWQYWATAVATTSASIRLQVGSYDQELTTTAVTDGKNQLLTAQGSVTTPDGKVTPKLTFTFRTLTKDVIVEAKRTLTA